MCSLSATDVVVVGFLLLLLFVCWLIFSIRKSIALDVFCLFGLSVVVSFCLFVVSNVVLCACLFLLFVWGEGWGGGGGRRVPPVKLVLYLGLCLNGSLIVVCADEL